MPPDLIVDMALALCLMMGFGLVMLGFLTLMFMLFNYIEEQVEKSRDRCRKYDGDEHE